MVEYDVAASDKAAEQDVHWKNAVQNENRRVAKLLHERDDMSQQPYNLDVFSHLIP